MGMQSNTCEELRKEMVTKFFGQPKDRDLTTLKKELIAIAASIPTMLGGGVIKDENSGSNKITLAIYRSEGS
jgi:hypothetical protein